MFICPDSLYAPRISFKELCEAIGAPLPKCDPTHHIADATILTEFQRSFWDKWIIYKDHNRIQELLDDPTSDFARKLGEGKMTKLCDVAMAEKILEDNNFHPYFFNEATFNSFLVTMQEKAKRKTKDINLLKYFVFSFGGASVYTIICVSLFKLIVSKSLGTISELLYNKFYELESIQHNNWLFHVYVHDLLKPTLFSRSIFLLLVFLIPFLWLHGMYWYNEDYSKGKFVGWDLRLEDYQPLKEWYIQKPPDSFSKFFSIWKLLMVSFMTPLIFNFKDALDEIYIKSLFNVLADKNTMNLLKDIVNDASLEKEEKIISFGEILRNNVNPSYYTQLFKNPRYVFSLIIFLLIYNMPNSNLGIVF